MPIAGFICPDNHKIRTQDCLIQCRMDNRCYSIDYLQKAILEFENNITKYSHSFLNSLRVQYLKRTQEYYVYPKFREATIRGQEIHAKLGAKNKGHDTIELDTKRKGFFIITEIKTIKPFTIVSPFQNIATFRYKTLQLNKYRMKQEKSGKRISKLQIKLVYDNNGDISNFNIIPVPILPNDYVDNFYKDRKNRINFYIKNMEIPPPCDEEESNNNKRCLTCVVWHLCDVGVKIHKVSVI